ncbi:hypothetical protein U0070_015060 [Myodes glareolus]|uniref:Uncharacterized protein n=1 Tax=Myodes glareolus TaxID=447135 RepID=A0AAW0JYK8_MYOGA
MYCVNHSAMKVEQNPEESQDMMALEKELDHFVKQLKQKLNFKNTCKLQPLWEKWVEEANKENFQKICKVEPILQTLQINIITKHLGLEKDVILAGSPQFGALGYKSPIITMLHSLTAFGIKFFIY